MSQNSQKLAELAIKDPSVLGSTNQDDASSQVKQIKENKKNREAALKEARDNLTNTQEVKEDK